jgi:hypothetical protein
VVSDHLCWANYYAGLGWAVFPTVPGEKRPLTAKGFKDATTDRALIGLWWTARPEAGIATPTPSVVDIEGPGKPGATNGVAEFDQLVRERGRLEPLPAKARTGGGGVHLFFVPGAPTKKLTGGIEIRGEGSYVVLPPSPHPSGGVYAWERRPDHCEPSAIPEWLLEINYSAPRGRRGGSNAPREDGRNNRCHDLACLCLRWTHEAERIERALRLYVEETFGDTRDVRFAAQIRGAMRHQIAFELARYAHPTTGELTPARLFVANRALATQLCTKWCGRELANDLADIVVPTKQREGK